MTTSWAIDDIRAAVLAEMGRQGITRAELARKSGLAKTTVSDLLSVAVKPPMVSTVADVVRGLGKSMAWLERQLKTPAAAGKD
jgi:lambda repressor-like predicted transcriptional regulator